MLWSSQVYRVHYVYYGKRFEITLLYEEAYELQLQLQAIMNGFYC